MSVVVYCVRVLCNCISVLCNCVCEYVCMCVCEYLHVLPVVIVMMGMYMRAPYQSVTVHLHRIYNVTSIQMYLL